MLKDLEDLIKTIRDRKNSPIDKSYTNKLLKDKTSVAKVREETEEPNGENNSNKIHESADVLYIFSIFRVNK